MMQHSCWFTPEWACVELVERFFPFLDSDDLVCEPSAGKGAFLKSIPDHVPAFGVEIEKVLAEIAHKESGRHVIHGDFIRCELPPGITQIIGNPPYVVRIIEGFLNRARTLADLRNCGLLLPAYALQTHKRVVRWLEYWNLRVEIVPRRLFPRLRLPLTFAMFTRGKSRNVIGLCLYEEAVAIDNLTPQAKDLLTNGKPKRGVWRALVEETLSAIGGEASLEEIYRAIEPRRPTPNAFWKEKVRQTLQLHHEPVERGRWRLAS